MEYQLMTTGKERLEYAKWKSQQDQIDQERVRRHKNEAGEWRREWDRNKVTLEYVLVLPTIAVKSHWSMFLLFKYSTNLYMTFMGAA
jgi:Domain of unknown function (DUF4594)